MGQVTKFQGRSTRVERTDDYDYYIYHDTTVVRHDKRHHVVTLDTGGYRTMTTKTRMNQCAWENDLDFHVHQKNYEWYVVTKAGKFVFRRGMRIDLTTGKILKERVGK